MSTVQVSTAVALFLLLPLGCAGSSPRFSSQSKSPDDMPVVSSSPADHQLSGVASYYADDFHGRKTANGEKYDMHELTAAHRTLPFNTRVRVTNLANNMSVTVRINDRGPFKDDRVIDLSLEAAKEVGLIANGTAQVVLEIIDPNGE
ncbi:MAG: septal ring lytic transglycosylase RlpA family protein [Bacteroidota bacterium]